MFLSAVFGNRQRKMSRSLMCHKMDFFFQQKFEKIGENENVNFKRLPRGEFWVFLSATSRSLMCHKMEVLCLGSSDHITFSELFAKLRPRNVLKELLGGVVGGGGLQNH